MPANALLPGDEASDGSVHVEELLLRVVDVRLAGVTFCGRHGDAHLRARGDLALPHAWRRSDLVKQQPEPRRQQVFSGVFVVEGALHSLLEFQLLSVRRAVDPRQNAGAYAGAGLERDLADVPADAVREVELRSAGVLLRDVVLHRHLEPVVAVLLRVDDDANLLSLCVADELDPPALL